MHHFCMCSITLPDTPCNKDCLTSGLFEKQFFSAIMLNYVTSGHRSHSSSMVFWTFGTWPDTYAKVDNFIMQTSCIQQTVDIQNKKTMVEANTRLYYDSDVNQDSTLKKFTQCI